MVGKKVGKAAERLVADRNKKPKENKLGSKAGKGYEKTSTKKKFVGPTQEQAAGKTSDKVKAFAKGASKKKFVGPTQEQAGNTNKLGSKSGKGYEKIAAKGKEKKPESKAVGNSTTPGKAQRPTRENAVKAKSKVAEFKGGAASQEQMNAARAVRTYKGTNKDGGIKGKAYGYTGTKNAETAKLDDYITLMAKGGIGDDSGNSRSAKKAEAKPANKTSRVPAPSGGRPTSGSSSSGGSGRSEKGKPASKPSSSPDVGRVTAGSAKRPGSGPDVGKVTAGSAPRKGKRLNPGNTEGVHGSSRSKPYEETIPQGGLGGPNAQIGPAKQHPGRQNEIYAEKAAAAGLIRGLTGVIGSLLTPRAPMPPRGTGQPVRTPSPPSGGGAAGRPGLPPPGLPQPPTYNYANPGAPRPPASGAPGGHAPQPSYQYAHPHTFVGAPRSPGAPRR